MLDMMLFALADAIYPTSYVLATHDKLSVLLCANFWHKLDIDMLDRQD